MSKKSLLDELEEEYEQAACLFQKFVEDDESETVRHVASTIASAYKACIRLVHKHLDDND